MRRQIIIFAIVTSVFACGGGGGGGGGSSQASVSGAQSAVTYSYDRVASTYTSKTWNSITMAKLTNIDGYYADYAFDVQSSLLENSSVGFDVTFNGQGISSEEPISYNWSVTGENTSVIDLYDSAGNVQAQSGTQNFTNAEVKLISYDTTWLANQRIQYTNLVFTEIDVYGGREDTFPLVYGDKTSVGDLSSSGNLSFDLHPWVVIDIYQGGSLWPTKMVAEGRGSATVNLSTKEVSGTINLNRYFDYYNFMAGGTDYSELFNISETEIALSGTLTGADLTGNVRIEMESTDGLLASSGEFKGALYGPDGDEIGVTFAMWRSEDNEVYDFHDTVGAFIGQ